MIQRHYQNSQKYCLTKIWSHTVYKPVKHLSIVTVQRYVKPYMLLNFTILDI